MENLKIEEIIAGEEILWQGKPKQGFQLVFEDFLIIPFMLISIFIGTLIFILSPFDLFGFLFYTVWGVVIYNRYIGDIISRRTTQYVITSKKVILNKNKKFIIFPFERIKNISFKDHPFSFKYGSVIIGKEQNIFGDYNKPLPYLIGGVRAGLNLKRDDYAIEFITDYKEVYNLIKQQTALTTNNKS